MDQANTRSGTDPVTWDKFKKERMAISQEIIQGDAATERKMVDQFKRITDATNRAAENQEKLLTRIADTTDSNTVAIRELTKAQELLNSSINQIQNDHGRRLENMESSQDREHEIKTISLKGWFGIGAAGLGGTGIITVIVTFLLNYLPNY
ncbi:hypothetical protein [Geomicrobium sp. JCM 19039]|uniref:hypothetical protein n=1 Tax=Geomicrobium sp. JCM 19039 TaxID=1460636 RepID=UPI00045F3E5D|nr:hypothetical protein [Geomicrobium sp. JCM 19039]GAK11414.1 hypothetical protein JCM19039_1108 [Geomicrobium sp. JCM 19039]